MPADRNSKRKAKRDPDASEDDDDDFEIKPKVKRSESDDESEEDVKPKKKAKQVKKSESDVESEGEDRKPAKKAKREVSDDEEEEAEATPPPAPKSKPARPSAGQTGDELVDEDGRPYFLVSDKKRVTLSEFKGKQYVNIREYYTDKTDGKDKPGKKGITLDLDQWKTFKTKISTVDGWIASIGSGKAKKGKK